jgi:DNA-binding FrmR family transcriptional regulator
MAHTLRDRTKLLHRVRRIRGQIEAVERALENDGKPFAILQTVAATRGALNSLMVEIIEGHVRLHLLDPAQPPSAEQTEAAGELIDIVRAFLR